jgi:hypothetical protein
MAEIWSAEDKPVVTEGIVADTRVGLFKWLLSWLRAEAWIG